MNEVQVIGRGLVTPLGSTPEGVLAAVREGRSALRLYPGAPPVEPFYASFLDHSDMPADAFFDAIGLQAARLALSDAGVNPTDPGTALVLSTIKGGDAASLADPAQRLAQALGVPMQPVVVSNACISGLAALVQGMRMLRAGVCSRVIVVGAELQTPFIVSGFQSLKALSPEPCRPFDAARCGLNPGEAAAAMVLEMPDQVGHDGERHCRLDRQSWELVEGAIRNDANHISGPSRTGEGSYNALRAVLPYVQKRDLAFVNVHGTATLYNDEMESIALQRAGLLDVPVNSLKGVFGHTMGAAGILECILSMEALEAGVVLPTRGFETLGVSQPVSVSAQERPARGNAFIKLLSGFGGVNGALLLRKGGAR